MKIRLDGRFLRLLILVLAVLIVAAFGLHRLQSARNAKMILAQARSAVKEGQLADALRHYRKYTSLVRNAPEVETECANLLKDLGIYEEAFFRYEGILRVLPDQADVRISLVEVALQLGRGADAKSHLTDHLLPAEPENPELLWLLGEAELSIGRIEAAEQSLRKAVAIDPRDPRFADSLARLLTSGLAKPREADQVLNQLIELSPEDPQALLVRSRWLSEQVRNPTAITGVLRASSDLLDRAWQDAQTAFKLAPESTALAVLLAELAVARKSPEQALPVVEQALANNPRQPLLVIAAAELDLQAGQPQRAVERLEGGLKEMPGQQELIFRLAQLQLTNGDDSRAAGLISELRTLKYPEPPLRCLEAQMMAQKGQWREAAELLESIRALLDRSPATISQVDFLLGLCYQSMGNTDQEVVALRRALAANPNFQAARQELASALYRSGRFNEATGEYWTVVRSPNPPIGSILGLARLLLIKGLRQDGGEADWSQLEYLISLLKNLPEATAAAAVLEAELQSARGQKDQSSETLQAALAEQPQSVPLHQAWIGYCLKTRQWDQAELALKTAEETLGDLAALRLERARLEILRSGRDNALEVLDKLAEPVADWPEAERLGLASEMASLFFSLGEIDRAQQQAEIVADTATGRHSIDIYLLMFELALRSGRVDGMAGALDRVREIEGQGPTWRVGRAIQDTVQADNLDPEAVESKDKRMQLYSQAMDQLAEAAVLRPAWTRIPQLHGEIMDRVEPKEARVLYDRVKSKLPDDLNTAFLEARLLFRSGDYFRLIRLLKKYGDREGSRVWAADLANSFAINLSQTGNAEQAEKFWALAEQYRGKLAEESPQARTALIELVAKRGQVERAIEMCAEMKLTPEELAAVSAMALQTGSVTQEQARAWIAFAEPIFLKNPNSTALGLSMADMYAWAEEVDKALAAYRGVLQKEPLNLSASNNFAMVLALVGRDLDEALDITQSLIAAIGPFDYLLDTRGLIHLARREFDLAEVDFRKSLGSSERADKLFHLALALEAAGRLAEAKQAMARAIQGGITPERLHPLEHPNFRRLSTLIASDK